MVAGPGATKSRAGGSERDGFHLFKAPAARPRRRSAGGTLRGSSSVRLQNKRWILSSEGLAIFGRRLAWQRMRHFARAAPHIILSDADEGLKWVREREFAHAPWLLDRWHIAQNVHTLVGEDQVEDRRIMKAVWKADSEALLEALRRSTYRTTRPLEFNALFGYILGNRDGIDN